MCFDLVESNPGRLKPMLTISPEVNIFCRINKTIRGSNAANSRCYQFFMGFFSLCRDVCLTVECFKAIVELLV